MSWVVVSLEQVWVFSEAGGSLGHPGETGCGWVGECVAQWTPCDPLVSEVRGAHSDADVLPLSPGSGPGPLSL